MRSDMDPGATDTGSDVPNSTETDTGVLDPVEVDLGADDLRSVAVNSPSSIEIFEQAVSKEMYGS